MSSSAERVEDFTKQMMEQATEVLYSMTGPEYVTSPILPLKLFFDYKVSCEKLLR